MNAQHAQTPISDFRELYRNMHSVIILLIRKYNLRYILSVA